MEEQQEATIPGREREKEKERDMIDG